MTTAPRLPRFVRRHGHKVMNVEWTVRPVTPKRRERKIMARIGRLMARRGMFG